MNDKNIVLIGMSGCGKTTIGKLLAEELKFNFVDVDEYIEFNEGQKIKKLFENGELYFRNLEKIYITKLSTRKNTVISTGGGVVLDVDNINNLKKNSIIIYIFRELVDIIKTIDTNNRPLLKNNSNKIFDLFGKREHLYEKYYDFKIYNNKDIMHSVVEIINLIKMNKIN